MKLLPFGERILALNLIKFLQTQKFIRYIHICVCMGTKTISITDDAYQRLASLKKENESFSLVIQRITGVSLLSNIQGILSKESAEELEKNIKKTRKEHAKARELRIKKIQEAFK